MNVSFTINGKLYRVTSSEIPADTTLNTFIRTHAQLYGTKFMCVEGGCGVCIVTLKRFDPISKTEKIWGANSCLKLVFSCNGLDITTIEGLGNRSTGYNPISVRLYQNNGTQCGYCTPGMVMNMYSLLEGSESNLTMDDIEKSLDGNICRCTGYRTILEAFRSFAVNADRKLIAKFPDIEDITKPCSNSAGKTCQKLCTKYTKRNIIPLSIDPNVVWYSASSLNSLFSIWKEIDNKSYTLVAGNTSKSFFWNNSVFEVYIDINDVEELKSTTIADELTIGAGNNFTKFRQILSQVSVLSGFEYCSFIHQVISRIASITIRNEATIAGNLMTKLAYNYFISDLFIILESIGATLTITDENSTATIMSIVDFLKISMNKKVLTNIILPKLNATTFIYRCYKIIPRAQNCNSIVCAGFLVELNKLEVVSARICFGGITPNFVHATQTENLLKGQQLYTNGTLQSALQSLSNEITPDWVPPADSPEYRKNLALSLFYKFILDIVPENLVKPQYMTGGNILLRSLSHGQQRFDTYKQNWPLTQPVHKYEGLIQCSGEAQYVNDIPHQKGELWAAFVSATQINATIGSIDASAALKIPGVHSFFSAKDIPGINSFTPLGIVLVVEHEEIFVGVNSPVLFYNQPVGVILAESADVASLALYQVKITYINEAERKPIIPTVLDAYALNAYDRFQQYPVEPKPKIYDLCKNIKKLTKKMNCIEETSSNIINGRFTIGGQYAFTMETQTTVCIPADDGIDVYTSTQWMDLTQIAIAQCLNISENKVNMNLKRVGGGFGTKRSRGSQVACAAALGCYLTNRPVRFVMAIEPNMMAIGKRNPVINEYEVITDDEGKILKLTNNFVEDFGCSLNEPPIAVALKAFNNSYITDTWNNIPHVALTDSPSNSFLRAPGTTEGVAMIENIMEHIARVTNKDPITVRLSNISKSNQMYDMLKQFVKDIDFYSRKSDIDLYNKNNRWRKRGIAVSTMTFPLAYINDFAAFVSIYHSDGSVAISHAGIEVGQGINTKVAQVAAYALGIPLEMISIKPMNNIISANAGRTGGSQTSDAVCYAVLKACEDLMTRISPVQSKMKGAKWSDITQACYEKSIDLTAKYTFVSKDAMGYNILGVSCAEVEVDILTGNLLLKRVDILEDVGQSISPYVDIGQIEGAFVMGIGYWLTEKLVYDRTNGQLLTNNTWTYFPPGANDIPIDFRVNFVQNSTNTAGVLRSKATGEPPLTLSIVVIFALRYALESARSDAGITEKWFNLGAPTTTSDIFLNAGNSTDAYKLT